MMQRTWFRMLLVLSIVLLILVTGTYFFAKDHYMRPGLLEQSKTVIIERGSSVARIASQLTKAGVIDNAILFRIGVRHEGLSSKLQAGEYAFPARSSIQAAANLIASGNTVKRRITIAEGLQTNQIKELVLAAKGLSGEVPDRFWQEGSFLPETYFYSYGDMREALLTRMQKKLNSELAKLWAKRPAGTLLKTPSDALVLASIIEKETGKSSERAHISGVFHNRLRRHMPLQSDPTVAYAVTAGKTVLNRPLTKADLRTVSPFNTYLNRGLPPGPIANPGLAAIRAAVSPIETSDLYFVADGTGGHAFARTLRDHNRNVAMWRRLMKKGRDKN